MVTLALGGAFALGCDSPNHGKATSPTTNDRVSLVSVRIDMPAGGPSSASVVAFRAETTDVASTDVLGAVDPLIAPPPGSTCELRDVAGGARAIRAQGGTVNLYELSGVSLDTGANNPLEPGPKVYPPSQDVISGVIAEAGPQDLPQLPESFLLGVPGQNANLKLALPRTLSVADGNEKPFDGRTALSAKVDLVMTVVGPAGTFVELRPFGGTSNIACGVGPSGSVVVPSDLLVKLSASAPHAPVALEAVVREHRTIAGPEPMRVSFEARSSTVVELRP
jgi:hypothetical protein